MNILPVVVLYGIRAEQSLTISSLAESWLQCTGERPGLVLVIYDNNACPQTVTVPLPFAYQYLHDPSNSGLARAYNYALAMEQGSACRWLLLLDQDSDLPADFVNITTRAIATIDDDETIVAVLPKVLHGRLPISPARMLWSGQIRPLRSPAAGVHAGPFTAINSGAAVRISFLKEIGGFDERFPLDYLDHWLFATINRRGRALYVTDARVGHDLSIGHRSPQITAARYRSILRAEMLFVRSCLSCWALPMRVVALVVRAGRQLLRGQMEFARMTARHLFTLMVGHDI